jgi:hypothetical protein
LDSKGSDAAQLNYNTLAPLSESSTFLHGNREGGKVGA